MKLRRKLIVICLGIILIQVILGLAPNNISIAAEEDNFEENDYEYYSEAYKEYLELSDEEKAHIYAIPRKYNVPLDSIYEDTLQKQEEPKLSNLFGLIKRYQIVSSYEDEIPETFNLRDKIEIPIKNQGSYGLCAVFSCMRSVETNLALHEEANVDLSELHVDYITSKNLGIYDYR